MKDVFKSMIYELRPSKFIEQLTFKKSNTKINMLDKPYMVKILKELRGKNKPLTIKEIKHNAKLWKLTLDQIRNKEQFIEFLETIKVEEKEKSESWVSLMTGLKDYFRNEYGELSLVNKIVKSKGGFGFIYTLTYDKFLSHKLKEVKTLNKESNTFVARSQRTKLSKQKIREGDSIGKHTLKNPNTYKKPIRISAVSNFIKINAKLFQREMILDFNTRMVRRVGKDVVKHYGVLAPNGIKDKGGENELSAWKGRSEAINKKQAFKKRLGGMSYTLNEIYLTIGDSFLIDESKIGHNIRCLKRAMNNKSCFKELMSPIDLSILDKIPNESVKKTTKALLIKDRKKVIKKLYSDFNKVRNTWKS